ncbi:MAG: S-layer family protein [Chromatiales bacterium]|nr:S-layer family protein [Chromatiales bacterium]
MKRLFVCLWGLLAVPVMAGVVTDGSVGPVQVLVGPDFRIEAALGRQSGTNLFHSLASFDLGQGESATFVAPEGVSRVIAGISGPESTVNGVVRTQAQPGTGLWLFNPQGIRFGEGAGFDLDGPLFLSTAAELRFADGARFIPGNAAQSNFSVAEPAAFGFMGGAASDLTFKNVATVVERVPRLAMVGGNVHFEGAAGDFLIVGGQLQIVAQGSVGEVRVESSDLMPSVPSSGLVSMADGRILSLEGSLAASGDITIQAGRWDMAGGTLGIRSVLLEAGTLAADVEGVIQLHGLATVDTSDLAQGRGGDIRIHAGGGLLVSEGSLLNTTATLDGDGGDITIEAAEVVVDEGRISTFGFGNGDSGDIRIETPGRLRIAGATDFTVGVASTAGNLEQVVQGRAGDILIRAGMLEMDGGVLNTETLVFGVGQAGNLEIIADSVDLRGGAVVSSATRGLGDGGNTRIETARLVVTGPDTALQSITIFSGNAGSIEIRASDVILENGAGISASTQGFGDGGGILIEADRLTMGEGTNITSDVVFALDDPVSGLLAGNAGDIRIFASESVELNGSVSDALAASRITSTSLGDGDAGNVYVQAPRVTLRGASLSSDTLLASGNAGTVTVVSDGLLLDRGGRISSDQGEEATGAGGGVDVSVSDELVIRGEGPGVGGGTIGSAITTTTLGSGDAGTTRIAAGSILLDGGVIGAASAGSGDAGDVQIRSGDLTIVEGGITTLATQTGGGRIDLTIGGLITLVDGTISTSVFGGTDDAGNITISRPQAIALVRESRVVANAVEGRGGNTRITADAVFLGSASVIEAKSERGIDGLIEIFAPDADITQSVLALPADFADVGQKLVDPCRGRNVSAPSTFRIVRPAVGF